MKNRLALLVVIAAAIGLVLTGCGRGPGTDKMPMPSTEPPVMPSINGTWVFTGFKATITVPDVMVTVGDGMTPLSNEHPYALITQIEAKGTLAMEGTTYKLTLAEGDDAIIVKLVPGAPPVTGPLAKQTIQSLIKDAQSGNVDITVSDDMMMITVKGSFLSMLAEALGMPVPEEGLVGCKDAPCGTMGS